MTGANADFYNRGLPNASAPVSTFQSTALDSNIGSVSKIEELTKFINGITSSQNDILKELALPGRAGLETQSTRNTGNALAGIVDPGLKYELGQGAAERGVSSGSLANTDADYLKSLGLTIYDLMGKGQDWFSQAVGRNPTAPMFDPSSQVISPYQQAQLELEQQRLAIMREQANRSRLGGGGYGGGRGYGGGLTAGVVGGTRPDLIPPTPPNSGGTGMTSAYRSGLLNTGGNNWFDDLIWDNSTPVNSFDPSAGNWFDDPFGLG